MKITFNLFFTSLGQNGGSHTLIRSANTLLELGHEVMIVDTGKNQHIWTPLKANHLIIKSTSDVPDADIVIATGFNTYQHTIDLPERCGKKYVWLRGYELWKASEEKLIRVLSNPKMIKIVNSVCLQNKLKHFDIDSNVIYPGYDFDEIFPLNFRWQNQKIVIGGLYNTRHKTKRTDWILKVAEVLKRNNRNIELWMFGTSTNPNNKLIDVYYHQPDFNNKTLFYNKVNMWLSPSTLEGLHMCPAEAMITECPVVGIDSELNGTKDYLINNETGIVTENNFESFLYGVLKLIDNPDLRNKLGICAREKILEIGGREHNMKKMVNLFQKQI